MLYNTLHHDVARLDYTVAIVGGVVILLLIFVYWIFLNREMKDQDFVDVPGQPNLPSQLHPFLTSTSKIARIKDLQPLLHDIQHKQDVFRVNIEKIGTDISRLFQLLEPVTKSSQELSRMFFGDPQTKGKIGERMMEERLTLLPLDWITRDVEFSNGRKVEFALRAPNGLLIPIDSKWAATELLDRLGQTADKEEQANLIKSIRDVVSERAREVHRYLDENRTMGFGIVTVPDAVLPYCLDAQARLLKANVVLVSYSLLVPYILIIFNLFLSSAQGIQALQMSQVLKRALLQLEHIQDEIDTSVRPSLDTVKLQQSQYMEHDEQLQIAIDRLHKIQIVLNLVKDSLPQPIGTVLHKDVESIPNVLEYHLKQIRENLTEGIAKQNGHNMSDTNFQK
jgi:hypothetical protein